MDEVKPEKKKRRFETKSYIDEETGRLRKAVFIDDKLFDWQVDPSTWKQIQTMGIEYQEAAKVQILKHYCDSISEFLGETITPMQVMQATKTGWI
jgi:hypothetical protein